MDVFALRNQLVDDYAAYIESFINISDRRIREHVGAELHQGLLWPDPLLQRPTGPPHDQRMALARPARWHPLALCGVGSHRRRRRAGTSAGSWTPSPSSAEGRTALWGVPDQATHSGKLRCAQRAIAVGADRDVPKANLRRSGAQLPVVKQRQIHQL